MTSSWSDRWPFARRRRVSCDEPWVGLFSIRTNLDVVFCPCYLQMKLGNLRDSTVPELWNAPKLVALRRGFAAGRLPGPCRGQLCPVGLGARRQSRLDSRPLVKLAHRVRRALRGGRERARRAWRRFA
jgi:hypothetical protein